MTSQDLRATFRANRVAMEVTGLALLAIIVALLLGEKAKGQRAQDEITQRRLATTYEQMQQVQRGFQPGTPVEAGRWKLLADSQWLAISHTQRLSLAQRVTLAAENAGLQNVKVRFGPADSSGALVPRPAVGGRAVSAANYTLVIDCEGGFARLLTFVNYIPAVVSIQHVSAARVGPATRYRVTLAVYEVANASQSG